MYFKKSKINFFAKKSLKVTSAPTIEPMPRIRCSISDKQHRHVVLFLTRTGAPHFLSHHHVF
jgi:hypothetical protein